MTGEIEQKDQLTQQGQEPGTISVNDYVPALGKPAVSTAALIVANCIPLVGTIFFAWNVSTILILYWIENVIIGVFNVLRMAAAPLGKDREGSTKFSLIVFFCLHYGMFCLGHGYFLLLLTASIFHVPGVAARLHGDSLSNFGPLLAAAVAHSGLAFPLAVSGLAVSHGISYACNFIGRGEYKTTTVRQLMLQPYGRIVILHLTILIGALLVAVTGFKPIWLAFLVVLKTGVDLKAHWREREKLEAMDKKYWERKLQLAFEKKKAGAKR